MKLLLAALLLSSCVTEDVSSSTSSLCGDRPLEPGFAVAFQGENAILSRADWLALSEYRVAVAQYLDCTGQ